MFKLLSEDEPPKQYMLLFNNPHSIMLKSRYGKSNMFDVSGAKTYV